MRLIDADALKLTHCLECVGYDEDNAVCAVSYCDIGGVIHLEEAPTIDAVPVVHGHWKKHRMMSMYDNCSETWHKCSECEYDTRHDTPYCPMCGARMDEVADADS